MHSETRFHLWQQGVKHMLEWEREREKGDKHRAEKNRFEFLWFSNCVTRNSLFIDNAEILVNTHNYFRYSLNFIVPLLINILRRSLFSPFSERILIERGFTLLAKETRSEIIHLKTFVTNTRPNDNNLQLYCDIFPFIMRSHFLMTWGEYVD